MYKTDVFCIHRISVILIRNKPFSIINLIRQSARLRTFSSVAAPASNKAAHQTCARVAIAKCPMHKTFYLKRRLGAYALYLIKRKLSCRYDPRCAACLNKLSSVGTGNRHLRARMNRKPLKAAFDKIKCAEILYDNGIKAMSVKRQKHQIKLFKLAFFKKRINRQIYAFAKHMRLIKSLEYKLLRKIIGIGTRPKALRPKIKGVCART